MEYFNERVRRIANLRSYGMEPADLLKQVDCTETELRLLVVAADMLQTWGEVTPRVEPEAVAGEFIAR